MTDVLISTSGKQSFSSPCKDTQRTHGIGCMLASAWTGTRVGWIWAVISMSCQVSSKVLGFRCPA